MTAAWGRGLATITDDGTVLDTWFRELGLGDEPNADLFEAYTTAERRDDVRRVSVRAVHLHIDTDDKPTSASDAYLRLHLLSHRFVQPRTINLDGVFGQLANVAWTNLGPAPVEGLEELRWRVRHDGGVLTVNGVDKFPRMTDYVVPSGVRIADARPGAPRRPPRRGDHRDARRLRQLQRRHARHLDGGGPHQPGRHRRRRQRHRRRRQHQGTLSGGGTEQLTIGERCLLGAEAGIGISLGDECVVEAGLYVTAGTLVAVHGPDGVEVVKARQLSGKGGLLYRRNSQSGAVEALPRSAKWTGLNAELHAN
jgi:2,3,4,5-tetrahydropyridine-2-carboxylate N-succinyltransferase